MIGCEFAIPFFDGRHTSTSSALRVPSDSTFGIDSALSSKVSSPRLWNASKRASTNVAIASLTAESTSGYVTFVAKELTVPNLDLSFVEL